tara:strand:- start:1026 stop:1184 length:159 start_codon:yes stop_codon:yes gene_type:complete
MRIFKEWLKKKLGMSPRPNPVILPRKVSLPAMERRLAAARQIEITQPWMDEK